MSRRAAALSGTGLDYLLRIVRGEARLTDAGGKLLAHGTGSCIILPREG